MDKIFKLMILLKIIQYKNVSNYVKKRFNPYNLISYICIIFFFFIFLCKEIVEGIYKAFKLFFSHNPFIYH